uniref:Uncharacterized protein n=1 Tax=Kalanchoe fedtschenkoi TaxID=63787 RepID=A0A7N0V768_KALFE
MAKACSYCGSMGHNSRTCVTYNKNTLVAPRLKLFGVQLDAPIASSSTMKKSCSVGCFSPSVSLSSCTLPNASLPRNSSILPTGYLSDDHNGHPKTRKKGVLWTEDEHRKFLAGLEKLGKGDWRGISKHFVPSRTPTQVASHAQKYFLRQHNLSKKRKGPSLCSPQTEDFSKTVWLKYASSYYSEAFCGRSSYLPSPMTNLLVANWLYNSSGLSTYPKCKHLSKPATVEAEPNLDLTIAAPPQSESTCGCLGT